MSTSFIDSRLFAAAAIAFSVLAFTGCASKPGTEGAAQQSAATSGDSQDANAIDTVTVIRPVREQAATPEAGRDESAHVIKVPSTPEAQASALLALSDYQQGIQYLQGGKPEQALSVLMALSDRHPSLSGPRVNAGLAWLRQEQPGKALEQFDLAIKANPSNPYAWNLRGVALKETGRFTDARGSYEKAITLDALYAGAHFNLGVLADLYLQDHGLAIRHYEAYQSLQRKPDQAVANWIGDLRKRTTVPAAPAAPEGP